MSYNSLKTTVAAAAVISVGALAFSGHAEAYWRHHYHHRHVAFVPVASMSAPAPAGYGMNGGYGTCIKRDPVWTTRGWRSDWVIDCAGKGAGYGGTAYYGAPGGSSGSRGLRLRGLRLRLRGWAPRRFVRRSLRLVRRRPARSNDVTGAPSARTGPSFSTPIPSGRCSRRRPTSGGLSQVAPILLESGFAFLRHKLELQARRGGRVDRSRPNWRPRSPPNTPKRKAASSIGPVIPGVASYRSRAPFSSEALTNETAALSDWMA